MWTAIIRWLVRHDKIFEWLIHRYGLSQLKRTLWESSLTLIEWNQIRPGTLLSFIKLVFNQWAFQLTPTNHEPLYWIFFENGFWINMLYWMDARASACLLTLSQRISFASNLHWLHTSDYKHFVWKNWCNYFPVVPILTAMGNTSPTEQLLPHHRGKVPPFFPHFFLLLFCSFFSSKRR